MSDPIAFLPLQAVPGPASRDLFGMLVPFAAIFLIFYLLLIRPQQKRQREHEALLKSVAKGDRVVTAGGAHVLVVGATEDVLTVEFSEATAKGDRVRFKIDRSRVERLLAKGGNDKKPKGEGE